MRLESDLLKIIAYLIWKGSYNLLNARICIANIIAYLIWKGSYNFEPVDI